MPDHSTVIDRWADQIDGPNCDKSMTGSRIFAHGLTIYSYGTHFPMATIYRARPQYPAYVLVNGDTFSNTTTRHQGYVRGAIRWRAKSPALIVPFSALDGAHIVKDSIRPLEICDDTYAEVRQELAGWQMERLLRPEDYRDVRLADDGTYEQNIGKNGIKDWQPVEQTSDGLYIRISWRHFLGEAIFSATVRETESYVNDDGHTDHRWKEYRAKFLSAFDHDERRGWNNYFLAQLPPCNAQTVADGFEVLAPPVVKRARARDVAVKRQGDIYAIPCELPPEMTHPAPYKRGTVQYSYVPFRAPDIRMAPVRVDRTREEIRFGDGLIEAPQYGTVRWATWRYDGTRKNKLLGTDHTASEVIEPPTGEIYARGIMRHEVSGWRGKDHADIRLGAQWHLIVRNTVPRA